jgi:hypothetical protein
MWRCIAIVQIFNLVINTSMEKIKDFLGRYWFALLMVFFIVLLMGKFMLG